MSKRYCVNGHDTYVCGRTSNRRCRECNRERDRGRYANDPEYAKRKLEREHGRYANDPEYAKRKLERAREKYASDPEYAERCRERCRERRADPLTNMIDNTKRRLADRARRDQMEAQDGWI